MQNDVLSMAVSDRRTRFEREAAEARIARRAGTPSRWLRKPSRQCEARAATAESAA
jgi:hypothetical protein